MIGTILSDRYEITGELGRGGMGVVYRARDPLLQRDVAVKMIPPNLLGGEAEDRIRREARMVARLDHPGIVPIHDLGRHDRFLYLIMPLVPGDTLRSLIRAGDLNLGDVLEIGAQAARALAYSHGRGIVHRDVKPSNVLVARDAGQLRVRLMDFGLARHHGSDSGLTRTGNLPGTLAYLSPEQVEEGGADEPLDGRSDLYSLGTLLYESLAGEPPFTGTVYSTLYRILHEAPQTLRARGIDVDPRLESIVLRCLAKDRRERPASGDELAAELDDYRRHLSDAARLRATGLDRDRLRVLTVRKLPLVGRDPELASLQERLQLALTGECQLVMIGGEAGAGKTRMLQELEALARARQVRVLRGRFSDFESAFPFQGMCDLVQDYFRTTGSSSENAADAPDLSDLAPDLLSLFPELTEIAELRQAVEKSSPSVAKDLLRETRLPVQRVADPVFVFELLARTLGRLSEGEPLLLALENLHAAEVALEALQYLVRRLGPTPTLIVGTYRQSELVRGHPLYRLLEGFADDPRFQHLELRPLGRSEVRGLVAALVESTKLRSDLVERIYEATEGNPFFTQELVQSLLESRAIDRDETGIYCLAEDVHLGTRALPATIQQAEERRIERLDPVQRELLSVAAVLGKSFDFADLEALASGLVDAADRGLDALVDELVGQGLLVEVRKSRGDRLAFVSGVLRDLLYRDLSRRRRRMLHRRHGRRLEQVHAGRLERVYPQLVDHFRAADEADATVRYALELARRSLETFSPEDSVRAARVALDFVEDEDVEDAERLRAELTALLARAYRELGRLDRSLQEAERSARAWKAASKDVPAAGPSQPGDPATDSAAAQADLARMAAEVAWQARRMDDVRRWVERGVPHARAVGDMGSLRRLLELGVTVSNLRGERPLVGWVQELRSLTEGGRDEAEPEDAPRRGGRLVSALATALSSVDPGRFLFMEEWEVGANVFETLLTAGRDGLLVAGLCDKWTGSDDGRRFHLTLRPDVSFSDGTPLDARAVKSSLERNVRLRADYLPAAYEAIEGVEAFLRGDAESISGIEVELGDLTLGLGSAPSESAESAEFTESGDRQTLPRGLIFHLRDSLPLFPALLTDLRTAVARTTPGSELVGTGPFRFVSVEPERVVLEENPSWRGQRPNIDRLEFRVFRRSSDIASGLRSGEIDIGRDLRAEDLEELLRLPQLRSGLVETVKKNSYFALFNPQGPTSRHPEVRRVLAGVVPVVDLVWRTLGRFAVPATGLIPPGVLGHDAGRRQELLDADEARSLLEEAGHRLPLRLVASVHPLFRERFGPFLDGLAAIWRRSGLEVSIEVEDVTSYVRAFDDPDHRKELDLLVARWNPAYDDPDNYTWCLLNRTSGLFRAYFDLDEGLRLMETARREPRSGLRQTHYRQLEDLVARESALLPLFHDIDYRMVASGWRGVQLGNVPPYVNYSELYRVDEERSPSAAWSSGGELHVPTPADLHTLDPVAGHLLDHHDVLLNVFETLTRLDDQVQVQPWLAESFESLEGGRVYRFRLREGLRFHDGRRLTARDVRWSFERLLRQSRVMRYLLESIRGAAAVARGEATELDGLVIRSPLELQIELTMPLAFFPVLLSHPATVILPEDSDRFDGRWRDGCCGTGPFRVVSFAPRDRLDLERFPGYWRQGIPRCERLVFHRESHSERIVSEFRAGRFSIAGHLRPADLEALRRDPELDCDHVESPSLATYFLAANAVHGPLADGPLRRTVLYAIDGESALTEAMGRMAIRALGLLPPGLLGYEAPRVKRGSEEAALPARLDGLKLSLALHPIFVRTYSAFGRQLVDQLESHGIRLEILEPQLEEFNDLARSGEVDLLLGRWVAVYPDADCFFSGLWQQRCGLLETFHGDQELESLIEAARRELDPALRHSLYRSGEDLLHRKGLLLPLFHEQNHRLAAPGVEGLRLGITLPLVRYEELETS